MEPVVKPWIERDDYFISEEDGDSGRGKRGVNCKATRWKEENNPLYDANCPHSPDLSPIENAWQLPKHTIGHVTHWDDATCIKAIKEGWAKLTQESINNCLNSRGKMTKYQSLRYIIYM